MKLTISKLREEAITFCKHESTITHDDLVGVTDGKAVGTYIEHKFKEYIKNKYELTLGSSARGIDLPDPHINTDIKVTSIKKPQNSSPFKNIEQKVYGLGYNLLIFIYEKTDINNKCYLDFKHCMFLEAERSGDYNLTKMLRLLIKNNADEADIIEVLKDRNVPGDNKILETLAKKIITNPPKQGYLTISNAFQWRLKYNNITNLEQSADGVYNYEKYDKNELEDYQTPLYFTDTICEYLKNDLKISPDIIIEPTCGIGNFIKSVSKVFPNKQIYGIEIDTDKINKVDMRIPNLILINEDILTLNFDNIDKNNYFLIIGNPPWITPTELTKTNSNPTNKPKFKHINNFEITQHIILKMIDEFKDTSSTIAFLCKKTVSRNVFIELIKNKVEYSFVKQINLNSSKIFKNNTDTCLLLLQFGEGKLKDKTCEVSDISNPSKVLYKFGFISGKFYSNVEDITQIDGKCQIEWKQGVKHDCANIMELKYKNNNLINKHGENVNIEESLVYPLLKSGDLKKPIVNETSKYILITQTKIKQDTTYIKTNYPKTWQYLTNNKEYFDRRKSSIYDNTPDFSIFGIGDYSFKKFKVAISGFCKDPVFTLIYNEKPFMLDDASYYLPFDNYDSAYITMLILNSELVKKFLNNIAFLDSKRPYAKKVLKRIDIEKCLKILSIQDLKETEKKLDLDTYISQEKLIEYSKSISNQY